MTILEVFPEILILRKLINKHSLQLYLVGGILRDIVLKRTSLKKSYDIDIAVSSEAILLAEQFSKKIKGSFILLDKDFGCARVAKKKNGILWTYDFADFRDKTFKKDLLKRDFTINTLAVNLLACELDRPIVGQMQDTLGALKDIKEKRIRITSKNVLLDDPLRLMRAYSLSAQLNFSIEKETKNAIKRSVKQIKKVSFERVREELFKILESNRSFKIFNLMDQIGLMSVLIPQIDSMRYIGKGVYHHLPVWKHSLCALKELETLMSLFKEHQALTTYLNEEIAGGHSRRSILRLACLLHDIGKPDTKRNEPDGRISFHGHERVGSYIVRVIAKSLMMSTKERHVLEDMVMFHLRPGYLANFKKPSARMIFRFFRDTKKEAVAILLLSLADQRATRGPQTTQEAVDHHQKIAFSLIEKYFDDQKKEPFIPLLTGHDLIQTLHLKPSPIFTTVLTAVKEAQCLGKITTKQEALDMARKML